MNFNFLGNPAQAANERKDHRIWWLILLALIGLVLYTRYDSKVFPSASIDLKLSRAKIVQLSRQWAKTVSYQKTDKAITSTQFSFDDDGKTFLEYELGTAAANQLMKNEVPIWSWRTRFCKEHEFEECKVWLGPDGRLEGLSHEIENDRALPSLNKKDALVMARSFVENQAGISLASYKLVKSASFSHPHRVDHSFTWQDTKQDFKGAKLRIEANISGNTITQFNYFLYVPENWERKFSTIRSYNNLLETIAAIFYSLIQYGSVFVFIWSVTTKEIRWKFSILAALALSTLNMLDSFNNIASVIDEYNTQDVYLGYLLQFIFQTVSGTVGQFISNLILIGAAETVYRLNYPDKIAIQNFFHGAGWRSKANLIGNLLGHMILAIDLGWVVLYYLSGLHFHFWCPLGVDDYQILSTAAPFFSAIAIGATASITEELMYRVLALSAMQKLTKNFWLSNLLQAAAWGFMHSTYPQQPAYARGVELTVSGLFHGWILRRYGIFPSLVAHYLIDAFLDVKPLFSSGDIWLKCSAILPVIPFAFVAAWSYWQIKKKGAIDETTIDNKVEEEKGLTQEGEQLKVEGYFYYSNFSPKLRVALCFIAGCALLLFLSFKHYPAVNNQEKIILSRAQAFTQAQAALLAHNVTNEGKKMTAWAYEKASNLQLQYIFEKVKLAKTMELAKESDQGCFWKVRYFKPLDPEEHEVTLNQKGEVTAFTVIEPEDAPGARLDVDEAKEKAETYLRKNHKEYEPFVFDNSTENNRKARTDYTLTYLVPNFKVADADFKISTSVIGDKVSDFYSSWDIPDNWLNEHNRKQARDEIFSYLRMALSVVAFILVLRYAYEILKSGYLTWQIAFKCIVPIAVLLFGQDLNGIPEFLRSYDTTVPFMSYIVKEAASYLQSDLATLIYYIVGITFALAAVRIYAPGFSLTNYLSLLVHPKTDDDRSMRRKLCLDAILLTTAVVLVRLFTGVLTLWIKAKISPNVPQESLSTICSMANVVSPSFDCFSDGLLNGVSLLLIIALLAGVYQRYCKKFSLYLIYALIFCLIYHSSDRYWQDYVIDVASSSISLLLAWIAVTRIIGFNAITYFLIGFATVVASRLLTLYKHGLPLFNGEAVLMSLFLLIPVILSGMYWFDSFRKTEQKPLSN